MVGLIGKKLGMTQIFDANGQLIPVTVIQAGPCRIIHRKTKEKHGYDAILLGFEEVDEKKVNKPTRGNFKRHNSPVFRYVKEFRLKVVFLRPSDFFLSHRVIEDRRLPLCRGEILVRIDFDRR